jgi:hypothetical protein
MSDLEQPHKEDARAPARGVVVVAEKNLLTTTTSADELLPLHLKLQAFSPNLRYSRKTVAILVRNCRRREPTASFEELSGAIVAHAESCQHAPNPIGTIMNWSRDFFSMADVEQWREEERRREAKRTAEVRRVREQEVLDWARNNGELAADVAHREARQRAQQEEAERRAARQEIEERARSWLMNWFEDHPQEKSVKFWEFPDELQTPMVRDFVMNVGGKREDWIKQRKPASG